MIEPDALRKYLEDLSDIPEEYQAEFKLAVAMTNFNLLLESIDDEKIETLFPFVGKTLLTAVVWAEKFADAAEIEKNELLRCGVGHGLFTVKCIGTRNFSEVEAQIARGMRTLVNKKKKIKIRKKTVSYRPAKCPFCGSDDVKEIIYGLPAPDFDFSKYISGGCCIMTNPPAWSCCNCFAKFFKKKIKPVPKAKTRRSGM